MGFQKNIHQKMLQIPTISIKKNNKMKNLILSAIAMAFVLVSCNQKNKEAATTNSETTESTSQLYACPMHPEVTGKKGEKCSKCGMELTEPVVQNEAAHDHTDGSHSHNDTTTVEVNTEATSVTQTTFSTSEIISGYLKLKNALTKDDTKGAANAGKALYATFNKVNTNAIDPKLKTEYIDIEPDRIKKLEKKYTKEELDAMSIDEIEKLLIKLPNGSILTAQIAGTDEYREIYNAWNRKMYAYGKRKKK